MLRLCHWFGPLEKAILEVRTQIIERARYRVLDLLIFAVPAQRLVNSAT